MDVAATSPGHRAREVGAVCLPWSTGGHTGVTFARLQNPHHPHTVKGWIRFRERIGTSTFLKTNLVTRFAVLFLSVCVCVLLNVGVC